MVDLRIIADKRAGAHFSADLGAEAIRAALAARGAARIILATGASQFDMLARLVVAPGIDWRKVTAFHLDEYVGLSDAHGASFRRYLRERFVAPLNGAPVLHEVDGQAADLAAECARLGALIEAAPIDVCFAGIGENAHLAFNDPPADFATEQSYIVVALDEACRRQQMGEGWFPTLNDVPARAISMSIRRIMASRKLILTAPDARKAQAARCALEGPVTPDCPASIIQRHADCTIVLDEASAALLSKRG
ncbi:MAG: glucosamine-6-phosphate deaminase [Methylobacteriaceae bacterium]|nr:glucosamine-6-phosphate deaminase [Methylobacteriaceae bacterium]